MISVPFAHRWLLRAFTVCCCFSVPMTTFSVFPVYRYALYCYCEYAYLSSIERGVLDKFSARVEVWLYLLFDVYTGTTPTHKHLCLCLLFVSILSVAFVYDACHFVFLCAYLLRLYSCLLLCTMPTVLSSCVHTVWVNTHVCYCVRCLPFCFPVCLPFASNTHVCFCVRSLPCCLSVCIPFASILSATFVHEACHFVFLCAYLLCLCSLLLLCTMPTVLSFCVHTFWVYTHVCYCVRCLPFCLPVLIPFAS